MEQNASVANNKLPLFGEKVEIALAFGYNRRLVSSNYFNE